MDQRAPSLYARTEHGGYPVHLLGSRKYQVEWPSGPRVYPSARQTLIALVNQDPTPPKGSYDPKMPFDRYFRRGRYQNDPAPELDIFALLQLDPPGQVTIAAPPVQVVASPVLTVHVRTSIGVDLDKRGIEVRKLFYAGFARKVLARGYDPEDVLQEVYKGILVRNLGRCPFDPEKSSFAHYVCLIIECIWSNYKRRYGRLDRNETFGSTTVDGTEVDVAEADLQHVDPVQEDQAGWADKAGKLKALALKQARVEGRDEVLIVGCLKSLELGMRPREISEELGYSPREISNTLGFLRKVGMKAGLSDFSSN